PYSRVNVRGFRGEPGGWVESVTPAVSVAINYGCRCEQDNPAALLGPADAERVLGYPLLVRQVRRGMNSIDLRAFRRSVARPRDCGLMRRLDLAKALAALAGHAEAYP